MYYNPNLDVVIYNKGEIKRFHPNVSFPKDITDDILLSFDFHKVTLTQSPTPSFYMGVEQVLPPTLIGGEYIQTWRTFDVEHTPEEIEAYEVKKKETLLNSYKNAIQEYLDDFAQTRGYDNIFSVCTYATSTIPQFKAEGLRGVELRDECWTIGYQLLADVEQGLREIQTVEEVLDEMPALTWD